jgi:methionyl-tRNA synthetase
MFWPANIHLIGKDICWFHAVIWPAMLMSFNLALPKTILAHGFVNDINGHKMSKSIGNVIDPVKLLEKYNPDVIRMYLAYATNIGSDLNVSMIDIDIVHDSLLAAKFSNLLNRCLVLTTKLNNNMIPESDGTELFSIDTLKTEIHENLELFKTKDIISILFTHLDIVNKYLTDLQPWLQKGSYLNVLRTVLEGIYIIGIFLSPFIPETINKLCEFMNSDMCSDINNLTWNNLKTGNNLNEYEMLFKKMKTRHEITEEEKEIEKQKVELRRLEKKNRKNNNKK